MRAENRAAAARGSPGASRSVVVTRAKGGTSMAEETGEPVPAQTTTQQPGKANPIQEAIGTGAFGGAAAGLAAHYLAGGRMTFPIFIVAYILILSGLKGWGKFVGLVVFTAVASLVVALFQNVK